MPQARTLVLFNFDWDQLGFARWHRRYPCDSAGFDLFTFPSNLHLAGFDLGRFVDRLAERAKRRGWRAVISNHEQFGALAAAMLAERMGWPGTSVTAVIACQHKLIARRVLQSVAPQANAHFTMLDWRYGQPLPERIDYPVFVKPVKAAFSVLARTVRNRQELAALTRFSRWELWVIRHLVEPFDRIARARLPDAESAHRMLLEQPIAASQYNLDGYVYEGEVRALGIVQPVMYPGTQAFMRWIYPCALPQPVHARALAIARCFLRAVGYTHGMFNMEFFYEPACARLTVIEFNPRMASQFSDLYLRVDGVDLHRVALELAHGRDPARLARARPTAGVAASFVYRTFDPTACPAMPAGVRRRALARQFPDALFFPFAKTPGQIARDFKWLGNYRYGILHLGGRDMADLRARCDAASELLAWPSPCARSESDAAILAPDAPVVPALAWEVS